MKQLQNFQKEKLVVVDCAKGEYKQFITAAGI